MESILTDEISLGEADRSLVCEAREEMSFERREGFERGEDWRRKRTPIHHGDV